jgi:hypothetical protein
MSETWIADERNNAIVRVADDGTIYRGTGFEPIAKISNGTIYAANGSDVMGRIDGGTVYRGMVGGEAIVNMCGGPICRGDSTWDNVGFPYHALSTVDDDVLLACVAVWLEGGFA